MRVKRVGSAKGKLVTMGLSWHRQGSAHALRGSLLEIIIFQLLAFRIG